jgi:membrane protein YqaA with SNARE-associated domain
MQHSRHTSHYLLFVLGAAAGSALGLILGSLLAYWLGEEAVETLTRAFRRLTGQGNEPNFELFLQ